MAIVLYSVAVMVGVVMLHGIAVTVVTIITSLSLHVITIVPLPSQSVVGL